MATTCAAIPANPELGGFPIRLSIYVITILSAFVPRNTATTPLLRALQASAGLNSLGLLLTAIIQTSHGTLTLYHAILTLHLLSFLAIAANPTQAYGLSASSPRALVFSTGVWIATALFASLTLDVWITAPSFGSHPECNAHTRYVIMFVSVYPTTNGVRWFLLACACIATLCFVLYPLANGLIWILFSRKVELNSEELERQVYSNSKSDNWLGVRVTAAIYGITNLELMVKRNTLSQGETRWGSGEILSFLIALTTVHEVLQYFVNLFAQSRTKSTSGKSFWHWAGNAVWDEAFKQLHSDEAHVPPRPNLNPSV